MQNWFLLQSQNPFITKATANMPPINPSNLDEVIVPIVNPSQLEELLSQIIGRVCRKMLFVGKFVVCVKKMSLDTPKKLLSEARILQVLGTHKCILIVLDYALSNILLLCPSMVFRGIPVTLHEAVYISHHLSFVPLPIIELPLQGIFFKRLSSFMTSVTCTMTSS